MVTMKLSKSGVSLLKNNVTIPIISEIQRKVKLVRCLAKGPVCVVKVF